jgi:hypothetical protein
MGVDRVTTIGTMERRPVNLVKPDDFRPIASPSSLLDCAPRLHHVGIPTGTCEYTRPENVLSRAEQLTINVKEVERVFR